MGARAFVRGPRFPLRLWPQGSSTSGISTSLVATAGLTAHGRKSSCLPARAGAAHPGGKSLPLTSRSVVAASESTTTSAAEKSSPRVSP